MNNETDINVQYVSPLKKICMTIGELPASYLETMSYYEMLVWFTEFLRNTIIPTVNNNAEAVSELQALYEELRQYVNNYFDNLDLQGEVSDKIDEMIEDGSFQTIIGNWVNENFYSKTLTDQNFVPREIENNVDTDILSGGKEFVEKSNNASDITYATHNFTIRDAKASSKINLSNSSHGVIENLHLTNENAGIEVNKDTGWFGSLKISNIFTNGCEKPFKLMSPDLGDTSIRDTTIENYRQAITTNGRVYIDNTYIGDNGLTVDVNTNEHAIIVKENAQIKVTNSAIGTSSRVGQNNPIIKFDTTSQNPGTIEVINSSFGSGSQNVSGRGYGGIAELNNANDRLIIDNCSFFIYPRINVNHNVAPFVLKPFKTVWSNNPFNSYIRGGNLSSILALSPNNNGSISVNENETNINPFGGNIITYTQYGFRCYYEIPERLINKTMYLHVYCKKLENANTPAVYYGGSDCNETGYAPNFSAGINGNTTPFVNIIPFTPNKKIGKIRFSVIGASSKVEICGIFLVEDINKCKICDYKDYPQKMYSDTIPTETGTYGDVVYSIDPETTNCFGWRYTTEWTALT